MLKELFVLFLLVLVSGFYLNEVFAQTPSECLTHHPESFWGGVCVIDYDLNRSEDIGIYNYNDYAVENIQLDWEWSYNGGSQITSTHNISYLEAGQKLEVIPIEPETPVGENAQSSFWVLTSFDVVGENNIPQNTTTFVNASWDIQRLPVFGLGGPFEPNYVITAQFSNIDDNSTYDILNEQGTIIASQNIHDSEYVFSFPVDDIGSPSQVSLILDGVVVDTLSLSHSLSIWEKGVFGSMFYDIPNESTGNRTVTFDGQGVLHGDHIKVDIMWGGKVLETILLTSVNGQYSGEYTFPDNVEGYGTFGMYSYSYSGNTPPDSSAWYGMMSGNPTYDGEWHYTGTNITIPSTLPDATLTASLDKSQYQFGETINVSGQVNNWTGEQVFLNFKFEAPPVNIDGNGLSFSQGISLSPDTSGLLSEQIIIADLIPERPGVVTLEFSLDGTMIESFSFDLIIPVDNTPPVISVPNNISIQSAEEFTPVTFSVSATDDVDGTVTPTCSQNSGSNFPIGITSVTCTATDAAGNTDSESFTITMNAPTSVPLNIELDKLNYPSTEIAKITITGTPSSVVSLLIIDPSDKPKGETKSITLQSDGTATYNLSLSGYISGAYTAVVSKGSSQSSEVFTVDLQTDSADIEIRTTKLSYEPGDSILVLGEAETNSLLTISLIDPNGNTVQEKESFSDKNGKISVDSLKIPSNAISGTWEIKAQSGSSFDIIEFTVGPTTPDEFTIIVEQGQDIPGYGKTLNIHVFGAVQTVEFEIIAEDGKIIKELSFPASSLGEINQSWIIPKDIPSGTYAFTATDVFNSASTTFVIENESEPEPESIIVRTSRSSYDEGDVITILGNVSPPGTEDVTLQIFTDGNLVDIAQVILSSDGSFSHTVIAEGPLWNEDGDYLVRAIYEELVAEDEFEFEVEDDYLPPIPESEPQEPTEVTIIPADGSGAPGCEETSQGCYLPSVASVSNGGVVIMKNTDSAAHTFTSGTPDGGPDGVFDTSLLMLGSSYEWTPENEGVQPYFCMVHPWMIGEIIVGEGGDTPTPVRVNLKTDKTFYHIGDELEYKGVVRPYDGSNVILQIFSPSGNLVYDERIRPSSSGAFTDEVKLAGSDYRNTGTYTLKAIYKSGSDKVQFTLQKEIPDDIPKPDIRIQDEVTIIPADGSGAPGCEETSQGCYLPSVASVSNGGVVIMKNTDSAAHTFTSGTPDGGPDGVFDTSLLMLGSSYEWGPQQDGTYPYFCMVHPWMTGEIIVGEGTTTLPIPELEPEDHIDLEIEIENSVYDINTVAVLNVFISGTNEPQNVAIDVTDPRGTTVISRSSMVDPADGISFEFKIDETFKTGNYKVTATVSDGSKTDKDTAHFKVKSQFNSFKITSVEITDQKGNPSGLEKGEIGFIKVNLESNKAIATLVTVNIFDSELTSIGIGSVQTTLSSGVSEIILSFNIPDDAAIGPAEIYVNAFSDWPSSGGVPHTGEVSIVEDIE